MPKTLITRAELARRAMTTSASVTRACKKVLQGATVGVKIDADHPDVLKYIADRVAPTTNAPAMGVDERYEEAIRFCRKNNRFTASNISRGLKMSVARAKRIVAMMEVAGMNVPGEHVETDKNLPAVAVQLGHDKAKHTKKTAALANLESGTLIHEIPDDIESFVDMKLREIIQRFGTDVAFLDWLKATKEIENINEKRLKNAVTRGELVNRDTIKTGVIEPFDTMFNKMLTDGAKTIARRVVAMSGAGQSVESCEHFVADQISSFIKPAKAKIARTLKNA